MKWPVLVVFLLMNFGALYLGKILQGEGANSLWYASLDKAPWTPPGWVFGAAWTLIMVAFSVYMARWWEVVASRPTLMAFFIAHLILNIGWNAVFFAWHEVLLGLGVLVSLTCLIWYMMIGLSEVHRMDRLWILPYGIWLVLATSLNLYILMKNG